MQHLSDGKDNAARNQVKIVRVSEGKTTFNVSGLDWKLQPNVKSYFCQQITRCLQQDYPKVTKERAEHYAEAIRFLYFEKQIPAGDLVTAVDAQNTMALIVMNLSELSNFTCTYRVAVDYMRSLDTAMEKIIAHAYWHFYGQFNT